MKNRFELDEEDLEKAIREYFERVTGLVAEHVYIRCTPAKLSRDVYSAEVTTSVQDKGAR